MLSSTLQHAAIDSNTPVRIDALTEFVVRGIRKFE